MTCRTTPKVSSLYKFSTSTGGFSVNCLQRRLGRQRDILSRQHVNMWCPLFSVLALLCREALQSRGYVSTIAFAQVIPISIQPSVVCQINGCTSPREYRLQQDVHCALLFYKQGNGQAQKCGGGLRQAGATFRSTVKWQGGGRRRRRTNFLDHSELYGKVGFSLADYHQAGGGGSSSLHALERLNGGCIGHLKPHCGLL